MTERIIEIPLNEILEKDEMLELDDTKGGRVFKRELVPKVKRGRPKRTKESEQEKVLVALKQPKKGRPKKEVNDSKTDELLGDILKNLLSKLKKLEDKNNVSV